MPYLICEECDGYYKLEEEESPQDYESCSCGGRLIYLSADEIDENVNSPPYICNKCGNENHSSLAFCSNCGGVLMPLNTSDIGFYHDQNQKMSTIAKVSSFAFIGGLLVIYTIMISENLFIIP